MFFFSSSILRLSLSSCRSMSSIIFSSRFFFFASFTRCLLSSFSLFDIAFFFITIFSSSSPSSSPADGVTVSAGNASLDLAGPAPPPTDIDSVEAGGAGLGGDGGAPSSSVVRGTMMDLPTIREPRATTGAMMIDLETCAFLTHSSSDHAFQTARGTTHGTTRTRYE
jgi:hypothetical protein